MPSVGYAHRTFRVFCHFCVTSSLIRTPRPGLQTFIRVQSLPGPGLLLKLSCLVGNSSTHPISSDFLDLTLHSSFNKEHPIITMMVSRTKPLMFPIRGDDTLCGDFPSNGTPGEIRFRQPCRESDLKLLLHSRLHVFDISFRTAASVSVTVGGTGVRFRLPCVEDSPSTSMESASSLSCFRFVARKCR